MRTRVAHDALRSLVIVTVLFAAMFTIAALQVVGGNESLAGAQDAPSLELVEYVEPSAEDEDALSAGDATAADGNDDDSEQVDERPALIEGTLDTVFELRGVDGVICGDDPAPAGGVATFMAVAGIDPSALEFDEDGLVGRAVGVGLLQPLFSEGQPLGVLQSTDGEDAVVPPVSLAVYSLDPATLLPSGRYVLGYACLSGEDDQRAVAEWAAAEIEVFHSELDPTAGPQFEQPAVRWKVIGEGDRTPVGSATPGGAELATQVAEADAGEDESAGGKDLDDAEAKADAGSKSKANDGDKDDKDDKGDKDDDDEDDKNDEDDDDEDDKDDKDDDEDDDDDDEDDDDKDGEYVRGALLTPPSGTSETLFSVAPNPGPEACSPDLASADKGKNGAATTVRWSTFVAPSWLDPAWITFDEDGPTSDDVSPLYSGGQPVGGGPVDAETGALLDVPGAGYQLTPAADDGFGEGSYWIGIACVVGETPVGYWAAPVTVRADADNGGAGGWVYNVDASRGGLVQTFIFERPAGALILTQRCGVHNDIPPTAAVQDFPGFPFDLPAVPGTTDQVGRAPDIDLTSETIEPDPLFDQYPDAGTNPSRCGVDLGVGDVILDGPLAGRYFAASGIMNEITVLDNRAIDAGWSVTGSVSDFTSPSDAFDGSHLGWTPIVSADSDPTSADGYDQLVTAGPEILPGTGVDIGQGLASGGGRVLASALPGQGLGMAVLDARVRLLAPVGIDAGIYEAVMTITVM